MWSPLKYRYAVLERVWRRRLFLCPICKVQPTYYQPIFHPLFSRFFVYKCFFLKYGYTTTKKVYFSKINYPNSLYKKIIFKILRWKHLFFVSGKLPTCRERMSGTLRIPQNEIAWNSMGAAKVTDMSGSYRHENR